MMLGMSCLLAFLTTFATAATIQNSAHPGLAHSYHLPQIADGQFGGGDIQTTFVLFNNGRSAASVALALTDDDGGPFAVTIPELGTSDSFEFTLGRGEIRFLQTDASGDARAGSALALSDVPIGVSAIFTLRDPERNFLTESGIPASQQSTSLTLPVDVADGLNTGIAIRNADSLEPAAVTLTLYDSEGIQRGAAVVAIPPGGHTAQFVSGDLFPSMAAFRGKLEAVSNRPIAALALRQNASPLSFTTLPLASGDSVQTNFALPQVVNSRLARTTFVLFNLNSMQAANVVVRLTGDDGEPFSVQLTDGRGGSEFAIVIPPDGTRFLRTSGLGETGAGAARVSSDVPIGAAGILTVLDGSGNFVSETGIGTSPSLSKMTIPVEGGIRGTGVALFNDNAEFALVSVRFNAAAGEPVSPNSNFDFQANGPVRLPPLGHLAVFVSEFGLDVEGRAGALAISSTPPVSAQTLRQNRDPLAFTTLPVAEGIASTVSASSLALPARIQEVDLTADLVLDRELTGGFELSGGIALPVSFDRLVAVSAFRENDGLFVPGAVAGAPSRYRIILPTGVYTLRVSYFAEEPPLFPVGSEPSQVAAPLSFPRDARRLLGRLVPLATSPPISAVTAVSEISGVVVDGDSLRNLRIPFAVRSLVTGRVTGLETLPQGLSEFPPTLHFFSTDGAATSGVVGLGEDGSFRIRLADGAYSVIMLVSETEQVPGQPAARRLVQLANLALGELTVRGSTINADFAAPDLVQLSGTVASAYSGEIPSGTAVAASEATGDPLAFGSSYSLVSANGDYRMHVARNRGYRFAILMPLESPEGFISTPQPENAPVETFASAAVRDFLNFPTLPATVMLSGRVTGPSGPLAGAVVTAAARGLTGAPDLSFETAAATDADGRYELPALSGVDYSIRFSAPPPSFDFAAETQLDSDFFR